MDFALKPTLTGELVELRPFTVADAEAMQRILADPEVLRLTGSTHSSAERDELPLSELRDW